MTANPYLLGTPLGIAAGAGTAVFTITTPSAAGDALFAAIGDSNAVVSSVADTQGNQWVKGPNAATGQKCSLWTVTGAVKPLTLTGNAGGPDQITVTYAASGGNHDAIFGGLPGGSSGLDTGSAPAAAQGTSTSPAATSNPFAAAGELALAVFQYANTGGTMTGLPAGWTALGTAHPSGSEFLVLAWQFTPSAAALTAAGTIVSSAWTVLIAGLLLPAATVVQTVAGAPSQTGFTVVSKTVLATSLRLKLATNPAMTQNISFVAAQAPDSMGYTRHVAAGLAAGTTYYYQLANTPAGGSETAVGPVGKCKTLKAAGTPQDFTVAFGSCVVQAASDAAALDDLIAWNPDLVIHTGDFDYSGTTSTVLATQVGIYETQIGAVGAGRATPAAAGYPSSYAQMVAQAWGYYLRSDHEAGPDNGDSDNAYTATNIAAYQQCFPYGTLGDTVNSPVHGIYQTFVVGRVRFILIDNRCTDRSPGADTDGPGKTNLGATQLAWLQAQLIQPEPVKIIVGDVQWMGDPTVFLLANGPDKWWSYATERAAILSYIEAHANQVGGVVFLHGDAHTLGCTPGGQNAWGGFPVYCAAPFNNTGGGLDLASFSQSWNNSDGDCRVYGRLSITDDGTTITSQFTGWDAEAGVARITQTDTFETSGGNVSLLSLTPQSLAIGGGSPTSLTAALTASPLGSNTGVVYPNDGRSILFVQATAATTVTSLIGTTVQGQTVPGVPGNIAAAGIYMYGPYPSQYDRQDGTTDIEVDFGTPASISGVALVRMPGVS